MTSELHAAVRRGLDAERTVAWRIDEYENLLVTLRGDPTRWFSLDLGYRYTLPEYAYDTVDQPDAIAKQLDRGLAYVHDRCEEVVRKRRHTTLSWTLTFPDGSVATAWRTPLQRLRHRLTGRSRLVQAGHIPY